MMSVEHTTETINRLLTSKDFAAVLDFFFFFRLGHSLFLNMHGVLNNFRCNYIKRTLDRTKNKNETNLSVLYYIFTATSFSP